MSATTRSAYYWLDGQSCSIGSSYASLNGQSMAPYSPYAKLSSLGSHSTDERALASSSPMTPQAKLYSIFNRMRSEISKIFDKGTESDNTERAWAIFMGIGEHFVLHVAPNFETSAVYNPCETDTQNPMLVFGQYMHCSKRVMDAIKGIFPAQHQDLPPQCAFAIQCNTQWASSVRGLRFDAIQEQLENVICDAGDTTVNTENFTLSLLTPSGTKSLSFKKEGFPLQFWTHLSRREALSGTIATDEQTLAGLSDGTEKEQLIEKLVVMRDAEALEIRVDALNDEIKALILQMQPAEAKKAKNLLLIEGFENNTKLSETKRQSKIAEKKAENKLLTSQLQQLSDEITAQQTYLGVAEQTLEDFKAEHPTLPTSYVAATFQIAADFELNGEHIYKRFSKGGHILTGDGSLAYSDEVHLAYEGL